MTNAAALPAAEIAKAVEQRRNFAIISHPDAGKTTLTEKLLLYGGAIQEAGAVKAKRAQRSATSDWMELEQQRGISITSTVLQFAYGGYTINLLDTPGHQDFSEDTYRTLAAADNAVMLEDAAKGLEPQTLKLFEVCRMRSLPIFTFFNKMDRPARDPLELLDEIEQRLDLQTYAVNWPIGMGDRFKGVFDRRTRQIHLFERTAHGSRAAKDTVVDLGDPRIEDLLEQDLYYQFKEELEVIEELGPELDLEAVHAGKMTPVFFGSAMTNFGVQLFLDAFLDYALKPSPAIAPSAKYPPPTKNSPALCSSSRPIWIPNTATESPLCGSVPASLRKTWWSTMPGLAKPCGCLTPKSCLPRAASPSKKPIPAMSSASITPVCLPLATPSTRASA